MYLPAPVPPPQPEPPVEDRQCGGERGEEDDHVEGPPLELSGGIAHCVEGGGVPGGQGGLRPEGERGVQVHRQQLLGLVQGAGTRDKLGYGGCKNVVCLIIKPC